MTTHVSDLTDPASEGACERPDRWRSAKAQPRPAGAAPSALAGTLWMAGWLFTIGFAKLVWWKVLLGLIVWPYFLGAYVR